MGSQRRRLTQAAEQELERQRDEILARHSRLTGKGRPQRCATSLAEKRNPDELWWWQGSDRKVILLDEQHAKDCARELAVLYGGAPLRPYRCPRSKRGHYHLTSDEEAASVGARRERE